MTGANCEHELPFHQWRAGRFCQLRDRCQFPKCKGITGSSTPAESSQNDDSEASDSDPLAGVSADFSLVERGILDGNMRTGQKLSDSHDGAGVWQWCGPYESKGKTYFRYQWGIGRKVKETIHIPGGCNTNPVALERARQVWWGIHRRGWSVEQTKDFISPWRGHRARL